MFKKKDGLEGMINYLDYMTESFNAVGQGLPSIELLVDYGKKLGNFSKEYKIEENHVPGCISNVYINAKLADGKVYYQGSSETLVVGGYVKILTEAFNGLTPEEIARSEPYILKFLEQTSLPANLTPSRANALSNIYRLMIKKAHSFNLP